MNSLSHLPPPPSPGGYVKGKMPKQWVRVSLVFIAAVVLVIVAVLYFSGELSLTRITRVSTIRRELPELVAPGGTVVQPVRVHAHRCGAPGESDPATGSMTVRMPGDRDAAELIYRRLVPRRGWHEQFAEPGESPDPSIIEYTKDFGGHDGTGGLSIRFQPDGVTTLVDLHIEGELYQACSDGF